MPSFYRQAPKQPVTNAFVYLAALSAILAAIITGIIYYNYSTLIFPAYADFLDNGLPDNLFFEKGNIEYHGVNPHKYYAQLEDKKFGIFVDTSGGTEDIPEGFAEVFLITDKKLFFGNSKNKREILIPSERISAKEYISGLFKPNRTRAIIEGAQSFTVLFTGAVLIAGVFAGIIFTAIGRKVSSMKFGNQFIIASYASTPLFAGAIAIQGIPYRFLILFMLIISFFLFMTLLIFGTLEFARIYSVSNGGESNK